MILQRRGLSPSPTETFGAEKVGGEGRKGNISFLIKAGRVGIRIAKVSG
jgi:hypothetical protein